MGVPFPLVALEIMRFCLPPQHAQTILYGGNTYAPEQALGLGLVDELADEDRLRERALEVAGELAFIPQASFRSTKLGLRRPALEACERLRSEVAAQVMETWVSEDARRAIRSYVEITLRR